jgi:eukaryotic-like serine/threonine-protein kinase
MMGEGAPSATGAELAEGTQVGEYVIVGKVADGGMGSVYSATHPIIGKKAAIKVIHPALCADADAVKRFVMEARAVNQIGHPNIVDVFSFGTLGDGRSWFAMELLQGESLAQRLRRGGMSLSDAADIVEQLSRGLRAAHTKGIVHRDLKPDNVFLVRVPGDRPLVKLLDFGIAKLGGDELHKQQTRAGMLLGTPEYMSPEQARGDLASDKADIYALGVMTYEMIAGQPPFVAGSPVEVLALHLKQVAPPVASVRADVPPELDRLITAMLDKEPSRRPALPIIRAAISTLRPVLATTVRTKAPTAPAPRPAEVVTEPVPRLPNRKLIIGSAAGLCVAIVGVVGALAWPRSRPPEPPAPIAAPRPAPVVMPLAQPGTVEVTVNVSRARIELDGKVLAEAAAGATAKVEAARPHDLVVSAPGRRPFQTTLTVSSGGTLSVPVKLVRGSAGTSAKAPAPPSPATPTKAGAPPSRQRGWVDPFSDK